MLLQDLYKSRWRALFPERKCLQAPSTGRDTKWHSGHCWGTAMPHRKAQLRLPTSQTSTVESTSERENNGGTRPKTTPRVTIRSAQVEAVPASKIMQDQEIKRHAALLRHEVFNVVCGTVNMIWGRAQARKVVLNEGNEVYNSQRLTPVTDTLVVTGGVSAETFKEPVPYTPCVRLCPTTVDLSGVSSFETSDKEMEDKLIRYYQQWVKYFDGGARP